MQTIVKIIIAMFFSHLSVSEPVEEKKQEVAKELSTFVIEAKNCASLNSVSPDHLI